MRIVVLVSILIYLINPKAIQEVIKSFNLPIQYKESLTIVDLDNEDSTMAKYNREEIGQLKSLYGHYYRLMSNLGIRNPKVVFAQIILETGYFSSSIFQENNNLFGMKRNRRGFCKNPPGSKVRCYDNVHACYSDTFSSLMDYAAWQVERLQAYESFYKKEVLSDEDYIAFLGDLVISGKSGYRYAEDPLYARKVRSIIKKLERNVVLLPLDYLEFWTRMH